MVATTMTSVTWAEKRQQLKKEIISYFHERGATKEQIINAARFIKSNSEIAAEMALYDRVDYADEEFLEPIIRENFREEVQESVLDFCVRASEIHFELLEYLERQRIWDEETKLEMIVSPDKIILKALEVGEGLQKKLPRNGTYLENSQWEFPLSCRSQIEELAQPAVLKYPGVGEILLEKFDPQKFRTEKVGFEVWTNVFNLSEGWGGEDDLRSSCLWRGRRTVEEFKSLIWEEISRYLPRYKKGTLPISGNWANYKGFYFHHLVRLAFLVNKGERVKLLYRSDFEHATLIKRCIYWLVSEI